MRRTEPSIHLYAGKAYEPSWTYVPKSIVVPRLNGHFGLVPEHQDQIQRNSVTPTHAEDTDMEGA